MLRTLTSFLSVLFMLISGIFGVFVGKTDLSGLLSVFRQPLFPEQSDNRIELYDFDDSSVRLDKETQVSYVNNMLIVFFEENADEEQREEIIARVGGKCVGRIDLVRQWQVEVEADDYDGLMEKCDFLKSDPLISNAFVESACELDAQTVPDDPWFRNSAKPEENDKWDDIPAGKNWGLEAIHAPAAWDYDEYFHPVELGVVDSGFYFEHEELDGRIYVPDCDFEDGEKFADILNKEEHGTHVAGIIGAEANNSKGISGIVWDCKICTVDCMLAAFQTFEPITYCYAGVVACIQNGAKAVNVSLGRNVADNSVLPEATILSDAQTSCAYLSALIEQNFEFVVVQASGNGTRGNHTSIDSINNGFFCCVTEDNTGLDPEMAKKVNDRIIVVGAAMQLNGLELYGQPSFSNAGVNVDICAPGVGIYSCTECSDGGKNCEYDVKTGTSQAAPHVTGVAGLIWAVNPDLTGAQVKNIICDNDNSSHKVLDNASPLHPLNYEYNLLDAQLCVMAAIKDLGIDFYSLDETISLAEGIDSSLYTQESLNLLDAALDKVIFSGTQSEIDVMDEALHSVLMTLDPKDTLTALPEGTVLAELDYYIDGQPSLQKEYYNFAAFFGTGSYVRLRNADGISVKDYVFYVCGDMDGNGILTALDQTLLKRALNGDIFSLSPARLSAADVNCDNTLDFDDYTALKEMLKNGASADKHLRPVMSA